MPVSGGAWVKNCSKASRPPADAPIPTIGMLLSLDLAMSARSSDVADELLSEDFEELLLDVADAFFCADALVALVDAFRLVPGVLFFDAIFD